MSDTLKQLILALTGLIRQHHGNPTKTRVLKFLYLADIEHYRDMGKTLTGIGWVFHLYGPWFDQYDATLEELAGKKVIELRSWKVEHAEGVTIAPRAKASLDGLGLKFSAELAIKECVERWAAQPLGELLNHVYFHTEPMQEAQRGHPLDFTTVRPRKEVPIYRRTKSEAGEKVIRQARRKLQQALSAPVPAQPYFTPPRYDEQFFEALSQLQDEDD